MTMTGTLESTYLASIREEHTIRTATEQHMMADTLNTLEARGPIRESSQLAFLAGLRYGLAQSDSPADQSQAAQAGNLIKGFLDARQPMIASDGAIEFPRLRLREVRDIVAFGNMALSADDHMSALEARSSLGRGGGLRQRFLRRHFTDTVNAAVGQFLKH